jgi:ribonuclease P protein component
MPTPKPAIVFRLRKHADYQRVYKASRKQFGKQMAFFFALRTSESNERALDPTTPRVGLTVGKVMGKAVDRNRIKRRMREAVRQNLPTLRLPVDLILHPRRSVIDLDFPTLTREVAQVFRQVQNQAQKQAERPIPSVPPQP